MRITTWAPEFDTESIQPSISRAANRSYGFAFSLTAGGLAMQPACPWSPECVFGKSIALPCVKQQR